MLSALKHDARVKVGVEKGSVYGAAILMPQLGRTLGWPRDMISLALSAYIYLFFTYLLTGCALTFIAKEEKVLNMFSGQMFLCDFGAHLDDDGSHLGPGGTEMTAARLYDWEQWATRNYVHDGLRALFPDRHDIDELVDPGEYGIESYWCRLLCCHIFVISIIQEFFLCVRMLRLFFLIPTRDDPWLEPKDDALGSDDLNNWLSELNVKVSGMPLRWKCTCLMTVWFPKTYLCTLTAVTGVNYLMETSSIDGSIVNSVALGFLLSFDELITQTLMSVQAKILLEMCADYSVDAVERLTEQEAIRRFEEQMSGYWRIVANLLHKKLFKLVMCFLLTWVLVRNYYREHCEYVDGRWVSKPMYMPLSRAFSFWNAFLELLYPIPVETEPFWSYLRRPSTGPT